MQENGRGRNSNTLCFFSVVFLWVQGGSGRVLPQEMMHRVQEAANAAVLEADTSIANALAKITCVIVKS